MNKSLPIYKFRDDILNAIKSNDTVIITAETGSGKSTQVPQMLYEAGYEVIVTEPRRIACVSLASRVSGEMNLADGTVAFHTAFESNKTKNTRITFCTDGLQMARGIQNIDDTILILDEVHEFNLNIETLLAWIREYKLQGNRLKCVIMSATVDEVKLADYYKEYSLVKVSGRSFNVEMEHVPDVNLMPNIVINEVNMSHNVLVFMEGKQEINTFIQKLVDSGIGSKAFILPLHGELPILEQNCCFKHYSKPKVIVATNIAQTSITINDIDTVVDNGLEKRIELRNGVEGLFINNISKADILQRKGRAGRTKGGTYILCSPVPFEDRPRYSEPEILRLPIEKVILKLLSVNVDPFTLSFLHQPSKESFDVAKKVLIDLDAIDETDNITDIGREMVNMPVSVRYARMLIESEKYGIKDIIIKAVAILENGSLINFKAEKRTWLGVPVKYTYNDFISEVKYPSDLLSEIIIYDDIIDGKYENLLESGLSYKSFNRIREHIAKLCYTLNHRLSSNNEIDYDDFIRCLFVGMKDRVFISRMCDAYGIDKKTYNIKNTNPCYMSDVILGIPKTITYLNKKYNTHQTMDIVFMGSGISAERFTELFSEHLSVNYIDDSILYDKKTDRYIFYLNSRYRGLLIKSIIKSVGKDDEEFTTFSSMPDIPANSEYIVLGNEVFSIHTEHHGISQRRYIFISDINQVLNITDEGRLFTDEGNVIFLLFNSTFYNNLSELKQSYFRSYININIHELRHKFSEKKSGKVETIINDFLPSVHEYEVGFPEYGIGKKVYIGLYYNQLSLNLCIYEDEGDWDADTSSAIKEFLENYFPMKYSSKNFVIKVNGKKTVTKECSQMLSEFQEYCQLTISETTVDDFSDNVQFIDDLFNNYMSKLSEFTH